MAYKVSYKVVSEQGNQLKNIAKDMDQYISEVNGIVSKLGNDELLQSVRADLNKFKQQLEEEKTILNLAGSIITDVVQSYTGVEKKSVQKVDKAKAHNRDFYKRPVAVASAGGGAAGGAAAVSAGAGAAASATNVTATSTTYQSETHTTNVFVPGGFGGGGASAATPTAAADASGFFGAAGGAAMSGAAKGVAAAAGAAVAAGAAIGGMAFADKASKKKEEELNAEAEA